MVWLLAAFSLFAMACTDDPSARYFQGPAPAKTGSTIDATSAGQDTSNLIDVRFLHGVVDRPDAKLTPGVVATTDLTAVCRLGKKVKGAFLLQNPQISAADSAAIYAEYAIPTAKIPRYGLDFLVPLQLGGANVRANIWPVSTAHGVGFHEKEVLNIRLHVLVCQRRMPLDQAQQAVAADWVKLWLKAG